jgi:hypothetical protein
MQRHYWLACVETWSGVQVGQVQPAIGGDGSGSSAATLWQCTALRSTVNAYRRARRLPKEIWACRRLELDSLSLA